MATVSEAALERLFSLELLVDWVHLEARLLPPPPPPPEDEEEEAGPPPPGSLRLAVAFRLLDFPTLLVYPPGGPAAPSRQRRPGLFPFGRGKSCLFRLGAAVLQRLLTVSPLYALLLTVPRGSPTPAPKLLGSCSVSLAPAARALFREGKGLTGAGPSQGHRGLYVLRDLMGERVGQMYLGYRLTDLGSTLLGHVPPKMPGPPPREEIPAGAGGSEAEEIRTKERSPAAPEEKRPITPPLESFAQVDPEDLEDLKEPEQQEEVMELVIYDKTQPKQQEYVIKTVKTKELEKQEKVIELVTYDKTRPKQQEYVIKTVKTKEPEEQKEVIELVTYDKTQPKQQEYVIKTVKTPSKYDRSDIDTELTDSSQSEVRESISTKTQEVTELEFETNIICPPPLYYSHLEPKKVPPAKGKFITVPQIDVPRESNNVVQEEKVPCPLVKNHDVPSDQSQTAMTQSQPIQDGLFDQDKLDAIRHLPLLNALLVELSLLYNQPLAAAASVHPRLAWLYRTEDGKAPEPPDNAPCKTKEVGDKLPKKKEEGLSPLLLRNQVGHNLRKGVCFEKSRSSQKKLVPRRKLFYGLTNTLKLRLKQTNPNMLILHEKREQYRKMQTEMPDKEKLNILPSKGKSFTEKHGKPHTLPSNQCLASDVLFPENIKTLEQNGVESEGQSPAKETHVTRTEKERNVEIKANKNSCIKMAKVIKPILPENVIPTNVSEKVKKELKVNLLDIDAENTRIDNIVTDFSNGANETVGYNFHPPNSNDSKPRKNSHSESIPEMKYSDDFTSPYYSEDFSSTDDTFGNSRLNDSNPELEADNLSYSFLNSNCKSSESRMSRKSLKSEMNSVLTPPFSVSSPVHSYKKSHLSKSAGKSLVDVNSSSSSDLSSYWSEGKEKQNDQNDIHNKEMRNNKVLHDILNSKTDQKSLEKSQSLRTSQVSSYLPSNLSELELTPQGSIASDELEENDELGSLDICNQYKDICELVINKLPGYTV